MDISRHDGLIPLVEIWEIGEMVQLNSMLQMMIIYDL
jgi:hypothetical protein